MAFKRVTFTVTCDTNGVGSSTATLPIPSSPSRHAFAEGVAFSSTAGVGQAFTLTVSENDDVSTQTWNGTAETRQLGRQLAFLDDAARSALNDDQRGYFGIRHVAVDEFGVAGTILDTRIPIRTKYLKCEIYGAASGDVVTVDFYYETAGDYRF